MLQAHSEIIILGGGPVGVAAALQLSYSGHQVTLIDRSFSYADGRVLALSYASYKFLHQLRLDIAKLNLTRIKTVQISHSGFGVSFIQAHELQLPELGVTIAYTDLCNQLVSLLHQRADINFICGEVIQVYDTSGYVSVKCMVDNQLHILTANLLILAEGGDGIAGQSYKRSYDYHRQAIIFHLETGYYHQNIAYERFSARGPLVLLPFADHYVGVWAVTNAVAEQFKSNPAELLETLNCEFAHRFGRVNLGSMVSAFPLRLRQVQQRFNHKHTVIIGNAAQTLHPVSAQGLNLGLRDVMALSEALQKQGMTSDLLKEYDARRNIDANSVVGFTHLLATKLEYSNSFIFRHLRGMGLIGLSQAPWLKNFVAHSLIFGL